MTVLELFNQCEIKSELRVLSAYNSKILCYDFDPERHLKIGQREVRNVWADMVIKEMPFGKYAVPIICAFADGSEEYEKEQRKKKERENDV